MNDKAFIKETAKPTARIGPERKRKSGRRRELLALDPSSDREIFFFAANKSEQGHVKAAVGRLFGRHGTLCNSFKDTIRVRWRKDAFSQFHAAIMRSLSFRSCKFCHDGWSWHV